MTIFEAYNYTKKRLCDVGIEDYVFEAKQIIKHITGLNAAQILSDYNRRLTEFEENNLIAIIHQREIRYPLQYIFGSWDFYGRRFFVGVGVLIPRSDTETVVEMCIDFLKNRKSPKILDLCAGTGCIGITLAKECNDSKVCLLEKYDEALSYTKKNIDLNDAVNAKVLKGDIFCGDACDDKYDLIVSNPPYIPEDEFCIMSAETEFEPITALKADNGGMEFYEAIINNYSSALKAGGMLCFETGVNGAERVAQLLKNAGYTQIEIKKDLNGIARAVRGIKLTEGEE